MVSAPRNGKHLQQAHQAGAKVEDVFQGNISVDGINMRLTYGKIKECN